MEIQVTTLSENDVAPKARGILGEWGLSILVEAEGLKVLLDAGQSISAVHNADVLKIDLSQIDKTVLSHGHYDHTGGLAAILGRIKEGAEIIAHPAAFGEKYGHTPASDSFTEIGIPFQREDLTSLGASLRLTRDPVWLTENIVTSGVIPMVTDYEEIDPVLYVREGGEFRPDPLEDDQALFLKTEQGLLVLLGCAHRGMINTLRHAQELTGVERVHTVLGGTHLIGASEARIELTIAELKEMEVQRLGVCHCTGFHAAARLAQEFGDVFFLNNAGTRLTCHSQPALSSSVQ